MAERGPETLRHGPMKPFGLTNPHAPQVKAYAVVQLRQDNKLGTLFNMVGFQTKLKHGEQTRIFRTIPGLEKAEFARLGGLHRNTFLNSPKLLDPTLRLKADAAAALRRPDHRLRGLCGIRPRSGCWPAASPPPSAWRERSPPPPPTTAHGALLGHITGGHVETIDAGPRSYQPMNVNFGLFPPLARSAEQGRERQAPARHRQDAGEETRALPPRAGRSRAMDRRRAMRRGGVMMASPLTETSRSPCARRAR